MMFQHELLIINLIKCLGDVHDFDISLATLLVKSVIKVFCELDQLCYAATSASAAMPILEEKIISVYMGHNI